MCFVHTRQNVKEITASSKREGAGLEVASGSESHDRHSVATAANAVREAIVLMSVHEERANVGRSIQAENAEASSLPLFSTDLADKKLWERPQATWAPRHP